MLETRQTLDGRESRKLRATRYLRRAVLVVARLEIFVGLIFAIA